MYQSDSAEKGKGSCKMPGVAPDIELVASNTHSHGLDALSRAPSTRLSSGAPAADGPNPVSPSPRRSSTSDSSSNEDEPAEAVSAGAFLRARSIYKGAQW